MRKIQKGFTLIELLVVIAIIGILAGILFVAIDPQAQTNKAEDAKVKSELASVRTQAALVFSESNPSDYSAVCSNANVKALLGDTNAAGDPADDGVCQSDAGSWVAAKKLTDGSYWCADSSGNTKGIASQLTSGLTACPTS